MNGGSISTFESAASNLFPYLFKVRRHIHAHPETGTDQPETVEYLARQFENMDVEVKWGDHHVGLVVDIQGKHDGPTIAFRADMDALEMGESEAPEHLPNKLGFSSTRENTMHACGHDAHATILLGLGKVAHDNRDRLRGTVRLLFQPGEEGYHGAARMVGEGILMM